MQGDSGAGIHRIEVPVPFPLKTVNCYYIHGAVPTLIDTGVNGADGLAAVARGIRSAGGELRRLKRIILTHGHTDHVGLAGKAARLSGAAVFIHPWDSGKIPPAEADRLAEHMAAFRRFMTESGLPAAAAGRIVQEIAQRFARLISPIDQILPLKAGAVVDCGDLHLTVVHAPGHSPGSICLFDPDCGVLIAGDCLLENITPNPVVEINPPGEDPDYQSLARYEATLRTIGALAVESVFPGHGPPFGNHAAAARRILRHQCRRRERVLALLEDQRRVSGGNGTLTPLAMVRRLFPQIGPAEIFLGLSEARSHLDYLLAGGRVQMRLARGIRQYRLAETSGPGVQVESQISYKEQ